MQKKNIIGLIGLGYVGLPLLLQINKKFTVYGFDIDDHKIRLLKKKNFIYFRYFKTRPKLFEK